MTNVPVRNEDEQGAMISAVPSRGNPCGCPVVPVRPPRAELGAYKGRPQEAPLPRRGLFRLRRLILVCRRGGAGLTVGNEEGHNEFEDFLVGHVFYVGRLWRRVLCVDGGGRAGGEAGFGVAVGGAVVSTELVALPAAVAEGKREGQAVVEVVVAEFVAVGPAAFVAVGQLVVDGNRFFHDVSGGEPVFLPCAGAGEVFDGAPTFDQFIVVFAE